MDTIEAFLERIRMAWDSGDAAAYGREFTPDATYVIFLGDALLGREEIISNHVEVFSRWQKGTKMRVKPVRVHNLGPDSACVLTVGGIGKKADIPYDKFQTFALTHNAEGKWSCSAFQNTEMGSGAKKIYNQ